MSDPALDPSRPFLHLKHDRLHIETFYIGVLSSLMPLLDLGASPRSDFDVPTVLMGHPF